jgi:hypothetical protein
MLAKLQSRFTRRAVALSAAFVAFALPAAAGAATTHIATDPFTQATCAASSPRRTTRRGSR